MMARILAIGWLGLAACGLAQTTSALWGNHGERWHPASRLPDVSYAGYACGERPIPRFPVTADVRDFGARGDGVTDDSAAFLAALEKAPSGAVMVPPGRYRITRILEIQRAGLVLRGAGPTHSVLVFPTPLNDIKPNWGATTTGQRTSNYAWSGGFVWFKGKNAGKRLGTVTAPASRGDKEITTDADLFAMKPGDWIEIRLKDDAEKSLLKHLYSDDPGNLGKIPAGKHSTAFVTRIRALRDGQILTERPLRTDIRPAWQPEIIQFLPTVTNSGVEDLGFEFPARAYGGHFSDLGFNGVAFSGVAHCWARNLVMTNADSAVFAAGRFCTIDSLRCQLGKDSKTHGNTFGHHGVTLSGHDNLLTGFDFQQRFIHDLTVSGGAGNVAADGRALDLCLDHHKKAPYDNVFTNLDAGAGTRLWKCGGGADLGRQCGAHGTFWNIRAQKTQSHPGGFGPPSLNLVAVQPENRPRTEPNGRWFEVIAPEEIRPQNLHTAQRDRRLKDR